MLALKAISVCNWDISPCQHCWEGLLFCLPKSRIFLTIQNYFAWVELHLKYNCGLYADVFLNVLSPLSLSSSPSLFNATIVLLYNNLTCIFLDWRYSQIQLQFSLVIHHKYELEVWVLLHSCFSNVQKPSIFQSLCAVGLIMGLCSLSWRTICFSFQLLGEIHLVADIAVVGHKVHRNNAAMTDFFLKYLKSWRFILGVAAHLNSHDWDWCVNVMD